MKIKNFQCAENQRFSSMNKKILIGILMLFALALSVSANPVLYPIGDKVVNESSTLSFIITSTIPNNGTSVFSKNVSFGTLTKIDETNATFAWTPTYNDAGVYDVKFTVSDDDSNFNTSMKITVNNVNRAPTINLPASETLVQGFPETVAFTVSDPDLDPLTFSVTNENTSKVDCEVSGTTLTMTAATYYTGSASCTVQASDGSLTASDTISITVQSQNPSVTIGDINFGNVDLNTTTTQKSFTITNNGNLDLHNINFIWDSSYDKYNINFTNLPSTLTKGSSDTAYVKMHIPIDQSVGVLTVPIKFTSDELNKTFNLNANVLGRLRITDLDVKVDDKTDSNILDKDKIGEKAKPQSHLKFDVEAKNAFPSDGPDIEGVVVRVTILDIDDGEDLEEESEDFDLGPGKDKKVSLEFDVPLKVDEGNYEVIIEVEGEDEDGNEHKVTKTLDLEVEKENHALKIRKAVLSQETVECTRTTDLDVTVINIGSKQEDNVVITVKSTALGIDLTEKDIELSEDPEDDDNEYAKTFDLNIPDTVKGGTYTIEVRAYYDEDNLEDLQRVTLQVNDCKPVITPPVVEEEEEEEKPVEVITPPVEEKKEEVTPPVTEEKKFTETTEYVLLLVLVNIIVIIIVIALLIVLLRR